MLDVEAVDPSKYDLNRLAMTREQAAQILPHRHEMQLIDGIFVIDEPNRVVIGYHDARVEEFWVRGHFPGNPVFPGVLQVEISAQLPVIIYKRVVPAVREKLIAFGGMDEVRFRGIIRPGHRLIVASKLLSASGRACRAKSWGYVNGKLAFESIMLGIPMDESVSSRSM